MLVLNPQFEMMELRLKEVKNTQNSKVVELRSFSFNHFIFFLTVPFLKSSLATLVFVAELRLSRKLWHKN